MGCVDFDFKLVLTGYATPNSSPLDMTPYFRNDSDLSTSVYMILDRACYTLAMLIADEILVMPTASIAELC